MFKISFQDFSPSTFEALTTLYLNNFQIWHQNCSQKAEEFYWVTGSNVTVKYGVIFDPNCEVRQDLPFSRYNFVRLLAWQGTQKWFELQDLHVIDILPQMIPLSESYIQVYTCIRPLYFLLLETLIWY